MIIVKHKGNDYTLDCVYVRDQEVSFFRIKNGEEEYFQESFCECEFYTECEFTKERKRILNISLAK